MNRQRKQSRDSRKLLTLVIMHPSTPRKRSNQEIVESDLGSFWGDWVLSGSNQEIVERKGASTSMKTALLRLATGSNQEIVERNLPSTYTSKVGLVPGSNQEIVESALFGVLQAAGYVERGSNQEIVERARP